MKTRSRNAKQYEEETDYSKASSFGGLRTFSGFSFGGGDYHLRIYNKTLESNKFKNKGFAKPLLWAYKSNYKPDSTVWRIEIQIRRAKLKKLMNDDNSTMDNYDNILNGIPSLWNKAMNDFVIKDISDLDTFNMLRGHRTLKNGSNKPLTKNAIYGIFKRSKPLSFWSKLKIWNGHEGSNIATAYDVPKSGAFDYVSNSLKSLLSTMGKHYGSVDTQTLIKAFKEANELNIEKKQISLLEDNFNKQIDWFEKIDFMVNNGVVDVPAYKHLENEIYQTVIECDSHIKDVVFTHDIIDRIEARANLASRKDDEIVIKDVEYLNSLINEVEGNRVF